jgi:ribosome-interacting GTPase 1
MTGLMRKEKNVEIANTKEQGVSIMTDKETKEIHVENTCNEYCIHSVACVLRRRKINDMGVCPYCRAPEKCVCDNC